MRCHLLESLFENLGEGGYDHDRVSPRSIEYNCLAWAAGDVQRRWWPIDLGGWWWPPQLPKEETLENFIRAFESLGYTRCGHANLETGIEKVALFVDEQGVPTHAARQLESGAWTSKCGQLEDIEHKTLVNIQGV